mmetsp:Transcript_14490/g.22085  ORF Transcript_14490/g.22085 Transcript_14490/m.22085 type:complete len:163 (-) Transcript_14490:134-622(-)
MENRIVEILRKLEKNDEFCVEVDKVERVLVSEFPLECAESAAPSSWIDAALKKGHVMKFISNHNQTMMLCLANLYPQARMIATKLTREENYVIELLNENNNNKGWMDRSDIIAKLKEAFPQTMKDPVARIQLFSMAEERGTFFVLKRNFDQIVSIHKNQMNP